MKRLFKSVFSLSGYSSNRGLFLHNAVLLLLFFWICRLYQSGFWVCLLAFLFGQAFLTIVEYIYCFLAKVLQLIREVIPHEDSRRPS